MRGLVLSVVSASLVSLWLPGAEGVEKAGTFQGEGVAFAIKYYASGVGDSPQDEAAEQAPEYSVRVFFATPARSLLANVGLVGRGAPGRVIFRIEKAELIISLGLPKGTYAFEGSYRGATHRYERVAVDPPRRRDVVFLFPEESEARGSTRGRPCERGGVTRFRPPARESASRGEPLHLPQEVWVWENFKRSRCRNSRGSGA